MSAAKVPSVPLPAVPLGRGELRVTRVAYGCWRIAGASNPEAVTAEKRQAGQSAVIAAYEAGITFFDLADIYCMGRAEEIFGDTLRTVSGMRERVVIATKCGIRFKGDPTPEAPYRYDASAEHIVRSCEGSLKRMRIEAVDLYLLHRPDYLGDPQEVARAFAQLEQSGKVRAFGLSNCRPAQVTALQRACPMPLVVNQVEMHLLHLDPLDDGTLDQCLTDGLTPMAWSPLGGGRLVDVNPIELHTRDHAHRIHVREVMDLIARELDVTRTVVALAWLLKHPAGIIPILGSTRPERIREALQALRVSLSREQWYRLLEVSYGRRLP
jgi:predicted oxidoreductase